MPKNIFLSAFVLLFSALSGCVSSQKYSVEASARLECQGREAVLTEELAAQRQERERLTTQLADLSRKVGTLEKTVSDQESELASKHRQLGESSEKMNTDIARLQSELGDRNTRLARMNTALQLITEAQQERNRILNQLFEDLKKRYSGKTGNDISIIVDQDHLVLTFSDKSLFGTNGTDVTAAGKENLRPLAALLTEKPELDAEVLTYTDNQLPKNKQLKDTWDWSLYRATNLVRVLISDLRVNGNQLTPAGRGEFYPVAGNNTPEGRTRNRRTEIRVFVPLPELPAFIQKP
ncbi:MAG: OmpA family protein [Saprospiraceae bacterium]|nr:OmpA family protein [Saprospiraceae bacterium]